MKFRTVEFYGGPHDGRRESFPANVNLTSSVSRVEAKIHGGAAWFHRYVFIEGRMVHQGTFRNSDKPGDDKLKPET